MFRTIRTASLLAIISASAAFVAVSCGERSSSTTNNGSTGSVDIALVQGGVTIDSVSYTITGPKGFSKMDTIDVSNSTALSAIIGGLPAGNGFTITLSATGADGQTSCGGSATFNVTAGAVTNVSVTLDCHQPAKTGSVQVNGTVNVCPNLDAVSASPASVNVGATVSASAAADDPDSGPSPLTYHWTASNGALTHADTASPTFACTQTGTATLTVTVSDGDATASCAAQGSVQVTCTGHNDAALLVPTATPIKHVVVIFGENISYDHYFGTYPNAANPAGDPAWPTATAPANNNLVAPLDVTAGFTPLSGLDLLGANPNLNAANGTGASNPFRLGPAQAWTKSQGHNYLPEQEAMDNGLMDLYPKFTGSAGPPPSSPPIATTTGLVMAYYDGNTLQTWWSLAQQYAMNDNSYSTNFGPSTPGAINLISGQTNGVGSTNKALSSFSTSHVVQDGIGGYTLIGDTDPLNDVCSTSSDQNLMTGTNIGDLLNAKSITWGWFEGGFDLTATNPNGTTGCARSTPQTPAGSSTPADYVPHHQPFQYYASTANPSHARPSSVAAIGSADVANHQYDSNDFFAALAAGNLPSVTYLKAQAFQDGHPSNSNPIDEQNFVAKVYNALLASQEWNSTALIMLYDDSDGWYDHQQSPIVNPSASAADALNGAGACNSGKQQGTATPATALNGVTGFPVQGRCGYGPRQPLLVASPYAKKNYIDHTLTDQTSVLKFVEDNWLGGQRIQTGGSFDTIAGTIQNMFTF